MKKLMVCPEADTATTFKYTKMDTNVANLLCMYRAFFATLETLSYRHDYETVSRLEPSECKRTELKVPFVHAGFEWRGSLEFTCHSAWNPEIHGLKRLRFIIPTDGIMCKPSGDNGLLKIYDMMKKWFPSRPKIQTVICDKGQRLELRAVDITRHHFIVQFYVSFEQGYPIGPCYDAKKFTALPVFVSSSE